jgi:antitoxin HicB
MEPTEILRKPYVRHVVPQPDGLFKAEILEFPGCFAIGETAASAMVELEDVAVDWLAAAIAQGQNIPEPTESSAYSGKLVLRMSKTLHRKATQFALRDGVSLNQFIVNCIAEHVGLLARPSMIYAQATGKFAGQPYPSIGFQHDAAARGTLTNGRLDSGRNLANWRHGASSSRPVAG